MRRIKLGVRLKPFDGIQMQPGHGMVELYDIDTGEVVEMLCDLSLHIPVDGAITVTAKMFIQALEVKL